VATLQLFFHVPDKDNRPRGDLGHSLQCSETLLKAVAGYSFDVLLGGVCSASACARNLSLYFEESRFLKYKCLLTPEIWQAYSEC
jgi:hypothetical protein